MSQTMRSAPWPIDLVIRGGLVVDGTGGEPFEADVGVDDGRIAAIGKGLGRGAEEIDAKGKLVTPGFVDIHTHYDGQAVWSDRLSPSSSHGVTTVVGGNCGVGFAPCRPEHRDLLVSVMEGVEDIPEVVMTEGLTWDWETYPEYLERHREAAARHRLRLADPALGGARLCDGPARRRPRAGDGGRPATRCRRWCARRSTSARWASPPRAWSSTRPARATRSRPGRRPRPSWRPWRWR